MIDSFDFALFVVVLAVMVGVGQARVLLHSDGNDTDARSQAAGAEYPVHRKGLYRLPVSPAYSPPLMMTDSRRGGDDLAEPDQEVPSFHEYKVRLTDVKDPVHGRDGEQ